MSKNTDNFLFNSFLKFGNTNSFQSMNISQRYVRLFPILVGSTRSTIPNASVFEISKNYSTKSEIDSLKKLEANPYFNKYVTKIKKMEKTDPIEFRRRLQQLNEMHNKNNEENSKKEPGFTPSISKANKPLDDAEIKSMDLNEAPKGLDSILKLELIENLPKNEIENLWVAHYSDRDAVCATISSQIYNKMFTVANQYPVFIYPIPRKDGYEIFVGQFSDNTFHFTSMLNYQKHKENSPSQLSLKHYVELQEKKDLVLMSGTVMYESINVTDAQLLSYLVQHFHIEHSELIIKFHESPDKFDVSHVISTLNNNLLSLASAAKKS